MHELCPDVWMSETKMSPEYNLVFALLTRMLRLRVRNSHSHFNCIIHCFNYLIVSFNVAIPSRVPKKQLGYNHLWHKQASLRKLCQFYNALRQNTGIRSCSNLKLATVAPPRPSKAKIKRAWNMSCMPKSGFVPADPLINSPNLRICEWP